MVYLLLISCVWAFSYGLIKGNLTGLSPDFVAFSRMALAFLVFLPFFRKSSLSLRSSLLLTGIGAVQYGLMYLFFIRSCFYLPAHLVVLFTACTPIYVTLINDVLEKSFHPRHLLAATVAFLGIAALQYQYFEWNGELTGFFLVQLSDLCFAFGQVAYKKLKPIKVKDSQIYALLFFGGVLITGGITTLLQGWGSLFIASSHQINLLLYLGVIASGLCFFGWNKASLLVSTPTLAVFNNVKIPLGVMVSLLFFGEKANIPPLILSSLLLLVAFFLTQKKEKNPPLRQSPYPDILVSNKHGPLS